MHNSVALAGVIFKHFVSNRDFPLPMKASASANLAAKLTLGNEPIKFNSEYSEAQKVEKLQQSRWQLIRTIKTCEWTSRGHDRKVRRSAAQRKNRHDINFEWFSTTITPTVAPSTSDTTKYKNKSEKKKKQTRVRSVISKKATVCLSWVIIIVFYIEYGIVYYPSWARQLWTSITANFLVHWTNKNENRWQGRHSPIQRLHGAAARCRTRRRQALSVRECKQACDVHGIVYMYIYIGTRGHGLMAQAHARKRDSWIIHHHCVTHTHTKPNRTVRPFSWLPHSSLTLFFMSRHVYYRAAALRYRNRFAVSGTATSTIRFITHKSMPLNGRENRWKSRMASNTLQQQ